MRRACNLHECEQFVGDVLMPPKNVAVLDTWQQFFLEAVTSVVAMPTRR